MTHQPLADTSNIFSQLSTAQTEEIHHQGIFMFS